MDRDGASREVPENPYPYDPELVSYTIKKLGMTPAEIEEMMAAEIRTFHGLLNILSVHNGSEKSR